MDSHVPYNDVSVSDGSHTPQWSDKMRLLVTLELFSYEYFPLCLHNDEII